MTETTPQDDALYPHQVEGASWLAALHREALLDEQGLGKTITVIEAANQFRTIDLAGGWRILVVAPTVVTWNWKREWEKWSRHPDKVQVVEALNERVDPGANVVVVTHTSIIDNRIYEQLTKRHWHLVVLDEAHFFRNKGAQRTRRFYGFGYKGLAQNRRVWVLTGTPVPNDIRNLWTMCVGLWPKRFPAPSNPKRAMSYGEFESRYCITKEGRWKPIAIGNRNTSELRGRLKDVTLRRTTSLLHLPSLRHETIALRPQKMPQEIQALDLELAPQLRQALQQADGAEEAFKIMGRHSEFATWRRLCALAKTEQVIELLRLEEPEKLVLFCHHKQVVSELQRGLTLHFGLSWVAITGDTPARERQRVVDRFQLDSTIRFAICQIVAGGTGVTLTESSEALFIEHSWVPGENDQALKRIHRIGQDKPCRVRHVTLANTCDELVVEVLRRKMRMIREVVK